MTEIGDVDVLLRALDFLGAELPRRAANEPSRRSADSAGWLVRRQHLPSNPCDALELTVKRSSSYEVLSFRPDDVERLVTAAATPPPPHVRSAWPARDVAIVETLAHCGVRVSELIGLTRPVSNATADSRCSRHAPAPRAAPRHVPIPRRTRTAVDAYRRARCLAQAGHRPVETLRAP
jgi:site-specific recombinase XerD